MDRTRVYCVSEISQLEEDKYVFTHIWNLKTQQMNIGEGKEK